MNTYNPSKVVIWEESPVVEGYHWFIADLSISAKTLKFTNLDEAKKLCNTLHRDFSVDYYHPN